MRNFFIIISFTISQATKKRSFWIVNIMMAVLVAISFMLISKLPIQQMISGGNVFSSNDDGLLSLYSKSSKPSDSNTINNTIDNDTKSSMPKVLIQDPNDSLGTYINNLSELNYNFVIDNTVTMDEIQKQINDHDLYSAVIINEKGGNIDFDYIAYQDSKYNEPDAILISDILKNIQTTKILSELGISSTDIQLINNKVSYNIQNVNDVTFMNNATIVSMFLALILYFAIFFYSYTVSSSVTSEKTSRVIETLVTSASPTNIIAGKTIGMGILGLLQLLFLGFVSVISFKWFVTPDASFINNILSSLHLIPINIIILLVYFLLGYLLFAFLSAIAGTAASKPEDVQIVNLPISLILIVSLMVSMFSTFSPDGNMSKFTAVFPITSAFAMPGRLLTGYAAYGEVIASILCLLLTILFIAFLSIRIYSIAILHYGNRLKIKDLFNMFIKMK